MQHLKCFWNVIIRLYTCMNENFILALLLHDLIEILRQLALSKGILSVTNSYYTYMSKFEISRSILEMAISIIYPLIREQSKYTVNWKQIISINFCFEAYKVHSVRKNIQCMVKYFLEKVIKIKWKIQLSVLKQISVRTPLQTARLGAWLSVLRHNQSFVVAPLCVGYVVSYI